MSARPLLPLLVAALALALAPTASADLGDETGPRPALCAGGPPRRAARGVRARESRTTRWTSTSLFDELDRRAARPLERGRPREDRSSADDLVGPFEYHLDFPGNALDRAATYERVGATAHGRERSRPCTPTSPRARRAGRARAPVLVLLRLQRLQQPPRGRLGDDPARLRRRDAPRRSRSSRSRSGTAPTKAPSARPGDDAKLELVDGTHPVVYPAAGSHANKFTEALYLGSSAEAGGRVRRHARAPLRASVPP